MTDHGGTNTGDLIDAAEALRLGLVNRVVASDALADATSELVERLAHGPTLVREGIRAFRENGTPEFRGR